MVCGLLGQPSVPARVLPVLTTSGLCPLEQAWFREGQAAEGLQLWEDAAAAYFEAHLLQPDGAGGVDFGKLVRAAADKGRLAVQQAKQAGA